MVPDQLDRMNHGWIHCLVTKIYHLLLIVLNNCPLLKIWLICWTNVKSNFIPILLQYFCRLVNSSNSKRFVDAYDVCFIIVLYIDFVVDLDVRFS